MSKVDAMQALREARYAARMAGTATPPTAAAKRRPETTVGNPAPAPGPAGVSAAVAAAPDVAAASDDAAAPDDAAEAAAPEALCGHRSMNNRTCRRPAGHAEKNHRYN